MKALLLASLVMGLFLSGCDRYYGPIVKNTTKNPIDITVSFSDGGVSTVHLGPGNGFWQTQKGRVLEHLTVTQGSQKTEYASPFLHSLLAHLSSVTAEAVYLIRESDLEVVSIEEAKQKGVFTAPH